MKILAIIPARFGSTRLPMKPLLRIDGVSLVEHVYRRVSDVYDTVVATDSVRIMEEVKKFGNCKMTSKDHLSGTDRCAEAASPNYDVILNVQCDLPFINQNDLCRIGNAFNDETVSISTLVFPSNKSHVNAFLKDGNITGFSRDNYHHIGVYGFRYKTLMKLVKLPQTENEKKHSLEQLRWLDNGYSIKAIITTNMTKSIDTYEDFLSYSR